MWRASVTVVSQHSSSAYMPLTTACLQPRDLQQGSRARALEDNLASLKLEDDPRTLSCTNRAAGKATIGSSEIDVANHYSLVSLSCRSVASLK